MIKEETQIYKNKIHENIKLENIISKQKASKINKPTRNKKNLQKYHRVHFVLATIYCWARGLPLNVVYILHWRELIFSLQVVVYWR